MSYFFELQGEQFPTMQSLIDEAIESYRDVWTGKAQPHYIGRLASGARYVTPSMSALHRLIRLVPRNTNTHGVTIIVNHSTAYATVYSQRICNGWAFVAGCYEMEWVLTFNQGDSKNANPRHQIPQTPSKFSL